MPTSLSATRRILRWGLIGLGGLVALAFAAVVVFVLTFNVDHYKPRIVAAVHQATGRTLTLAGPIRLKFALHPTIALSDAALSNPPGFSRPDMVRLHALDVQLDLMALLHGKVAIDRLVLVKPDILLERTKAGAVNWTFTPAAPPAATPGSAPGSAPAGPAAAPSGPAVFVQDVQITDGVVGYRDDAMGKETAVTLRQASLHEANPEAPLQIGATATVNGARLALAGTTGPLAALGRPAAAPWPVRLVLSAADARLALDGTIAAPLAGRGVSLGLDLHIPDLAALDGLAGTTLPPVKQVALTGRILAPEPMAQGVRLQDLALRLPQGQLTGALALRFGAVPRISGSLRAPSLDADALMAELRRPAAAAPAVPAKPGAAGSAAPRSHWLIPDTTLPFPLLRRVDADLTLAVASLQSGGETWRNLDAHLALTGGKLVVAPFTVTPPAGTLSLRLTVDAARPVPPVELTVHAPGLALASLLAMAGEKGKGLARGSVAIDAKLQGAGTSPHAIAAGLDGVLAATMTGGAIDNAEVNRLFGPVLAKANLTGLLAHGGSSEIRCLALRLVAKQGMARLDPFLFSSTLNTIDGSGTVNLGTETLDLLLHPQGRVGGTGFAVPVRVSGGFANPTVALSERATAAAGIGAVMALLDGKSLSVPKELQPAAPSCATALALARGQRPPPQAAQPAAAPAARPPAAAPAVPNPADLLRQLFR